jgi:hypothetical protein
MDAVATPSIDVLDRHRGRDFSRPRRRRDRGCATIRRMSRPPRDPLLGVERLLVDGSNLLHALSQSAIPAPQAALIGRVRAVIPPTIGIELLFDGPPEGGLRGTRIASGVTVRHSGRWSADDLALRMVTEATGGRPDQARASPAILVVTDDGRLASNLRARGAATIGTSWLINRLGRQRQAAPSAGRPRPPTPTPREGQATADAVRDAEATTPRWRSGRGATTKAGNARRMPRRARGMG